MGPKGEPGLAGHRGPTGRPGKRGKQVKTPGLIPTEVTPTGLEMCGEAGRSPPELPTVLGLCILRASGQTSSTADLQASPSCHGSRL